jgi:hypothetical protein
MGASTKKSGAGIDKAKTNAVNIAIQNVRKKIILTGGIDKTRMKLDRKIRAKRTSKNVKFYLAAKTHQ